LARVLGAAGPGRLVGRSSGRVEYDGVSGSLRDQQLPDTTRGGPVLAVQQTMNALHFVRFGGNAMKWVYFLCGLAGAAMLAAGLQVFVVKRRKRAAGGVAGPDGLRWIEPLNVGAVAGLLLASIAFFWANRLLPLDLPLRSGWEIRIFFLVWAGAALHALVHPRGAWRAQLGLTALLCLGLPLLNAATTGDHLLAALARGDGESAAVELVAAAFGLAAGFVALRLGRRPDTPAVPSTLAEEHAA
jgi:uncharacterized iron-regulated membrane protein